MSEAPGGQCGGSFIRLVERLCSRGRPQRIDVAIIDVKGSRSGVWSSIVKGDEPARIQLMCDCDDPFRPGWYEMQSYCIHGLNLGESLSLLLRGILTSDFACLRKVHILRPPEVGADAVRLKPSTSQSA